MEMEVTLWNAQSTLKPTAYRIPNSAETLPGDKHFKKFTTLTNRTQTFQIRSVKVVKFVKCLSAGGGSVELGIRHTVGFNVNNFYTISRAINYEFQTRPIDKLSRAVSWTCYSLPNIWLTCPLRCHSSRLILIFNVEAKMDCTNSWVLDR